VLNGPDAEGILVVAAMEQEGPEDVPTSAFLVESPWEGMTMAEGARTVGARGARVCGIRFQECALPEEARLGGNDGPDVETLERVPHTPLLVAGYAIGVGQACLEAAIQHARDRATFGRPIVTYQEVHFKIADMHVAVDVSRQLALRAAWLIDQGRGSAAESSVAKLFAAEMAPQCAHVCANIHAGKGLAEGSRVDRLWRDSRLAEVLGGTSEMNRFLIAGEVLAGRA
jgi:butyryl-CoA dehydrogenase